MGLMFLIVFQTNTAYPENANFKTAAHMTLKFQTCCGLNTTKNS